MADISGAVPAASVVIIVEDDKAVRNSLRFSLEIEGFVVRTYGAAHELLNEPSVPAPGCLVVDYLLPGMNGLELLAELRRRQVTLPAILITTRPGHAVRAAAAEAGVPLVEKPLLDGALFQAIHAALLGARSTRE